MAYPDLFILKKGSHLERAVLKCLYAPFYFILLLLKTITRSSYQQQAVVICIVDFDPKTNKQLSIDSIVIPKEKDLRQVD